MLTRNQQGSFTQMPTIDLVEKESNEIDAQANLYTLYRFSDKENSKEKLNHANKFYCLDNYLSIFGTKNLFLFANNCEKETILKIKERNIALIETKPGNVESFSSALSFAVAHFMNKDSVYFLEDDYLHLPDSKIVLLEGLKIADYATLYDHPDKYIDFSLGGMNRFIKNGGETSRVLLTKSSHWKETHSTTMTFAVSIKTLREDNFFWKKYKRNSFALFGQLEGRPWGFEDKLKKFFGIEQPKQYRRLISCVPGRATHCEKAWLSPLVDWTKV